LFGSDSAHGVAGAAFLRSLRSRPGTLGEDLVALAGKGDIFSGDPPFIMSGELQCHLIKTNIDVRMVIEFLSPPGDPVDKIDAF